MARKTVIKNGMKFVPKSIEVARAVALDNAIESGDYSILEFDSPESLPEPEPAESTVERVAGKAARKAAEVAVESEGEDPYTGPVVYDDPQPTLQGDEDE